MAIATRLGLGGKDLYRQARTIWRLARQGDVRAQSGVAQLDAATKTIHAAYKDLRRRDRFTADFRPTPYDVWAFRHDRAFGIPDPALYHRLLLLTLCIIFVLPEAWLSIPWPGVGPHLTSASPWVVNVLPTDLEPSRPDIHHHDIRAGFPAETQGCHLIFCDPPYHTMRPKRMRQSIAMASWHEWLAFLDELMCQASNTLRPGGYSVLLLSFPDRKRPTSRVWLPRSCLFGYTAAIRAGFLPERRISCPMNAGYLPQHVRRARVEGRMLGQVRDLLVVRRPSRSGDTCSLLHPSSARRFCTLIG